MALRFLHYFQHVNTVESAIVWEKHFLRAITAIRVGAVFMERCHARINRVKVSRIEINVNNKCTINHTVFEKHYLFLIRETSHLQKTLIHRKLK